MADLPVSPIPLSFPKSLNRYVEFDESDDLCARFKTEPRALRNNDCGILWDDLVAVKLRHNNFSMSVISAMSSRALTRFS
jgi:hypothetical protein